MMAWIERQERSRLAAIYAVATLAIALVLAAATVASGESGTGTTTAPATTVTAAPEVSPLIDSRSTVELPLVDADTPVVLRINVLADDADVTIEVVNPNGIAVNVAPREVTSIPVEILRTGAHACEEYAGTIVATAETAAGATDVTMTEVRYGACDLTLPPAAPDTVHDTDRVWGDEGRAPWDVAAAEAIPTEEPTDLTEEPQEPAPPAPPPEPEPTGEPAPEPTRTTEPDPSPTSEPTSEPEPTPTSEPTSSEPPAEPTSEPTDEPTTDPDPEPTSPSEPESAPAATQTP